MPSLITWMNSLTTRYLVTVESNQEVIDGVKYKQHLRRQYFLSRVKTPPAMKTKLTTDSRFDPEQSIAISPIELLHSIGILTTPSIPNLASLSSTWAIIRYIWAFQPSSQNRSQPLILSDDAKTIDFHQKTLLSDEIGIGMGYYMMTHYFGTPFWVDLEEALKNQTWNLTPINKTKPDYLFFDDPTKLLYLVECKGNQTSYDAALDQIRRGTEQVASITFSSGRIIPSLIISTYLAYDNTYVYIVDPPPDKNYDSDKYFNDSVQRTIRLYNEKKFVKDSRLINIAKLLVYAGFWDEAFSIYPLEIPIDSKKIMPEKRRGTLEIEDFMYSGSHEIHSTYDGKTVEIFTGMLSPFYQQIIKEKEIGTTPLELPSTFHNRFIIKEENRKRTIGFKTGINWDTSETWSICANGSIFHVKIH